MQNKLNNFSPTIGMYRLACQLLTLTSVGWLSLAVASPTWAVPATKSAKDWAPECKTVLRYDPTSFIQLFTQKNRDGSEVGQDNAAVYWANCKQQENQARLRSNSKLQKTLLTLRDLEKNLLIAETNLAYLRAGGGTMYGHGLARYMPSLENHIARLIALNMGKKPAAQPALANSLATRQQRAIATIAARLKRFQNPTPGDIEYTDRASWQEASERYGKAYQEIKALLGDRADATSVEVYEFLAKGLWFGPNGMFAEP